jgi:hypothetical protein
MNRQTTYILQTLSLADTGMKTSTEIWHTLWINSIFTLHVWLVLSAPVRCQIARIGCLPLPIGKQLNCQGQRPLKRGWDLEATLFFCSSRRKNCLLSSHQHGLAPWIPGHYSVSHSLSVTILVICQAPNKPFIWVTTWHFVTMYTH